MSGSYTKEIDAFRTERCAAVGKRLVEALLTDERAHEWATTVELRGAVERARGDDRS